MTRRSTGPAGTEHADKILAVADRLAQGLRRAILVPKTVETGPALALDVGGGHRHQMLERLVDVDDLLLVARTARYRDRDWRMIEQMLLLVVLDRLGELRRSQKLINLLRRRIAVVGAHTRTMLIDKS
jgi:hypothetical protein